MRRRAFVRSFILALGLAAALPCFAAAATAQPGPTPAPAAASAPPASPPAPTDAAILAEDEQTLGQLQNQIAATSDDAPLAALASQVAAIERQASAMAIARSRDLTALDRARSHAASRAAEAQQRKALQAEIRQARAVAARAATTFTLVAERRREGFLGRVLEQSASPLSPDFWEGLRQDLRPDLARLTDLGDEAFEVAANAEEPRALLALLGGALVALAVGWPGRWLLQRVGDAAIARRGRQGRFGRSARAVWQTVTTVGAAVLAAGALRFAAAWGGLLSEGASALAASALVAVGWAAAILALGGALVTDREPQRRLLDVTDAAAARARRLLRLAAPVTAAGYLLSRLNYIVGASVSATIAANAVVALAYALLAGAALIVASRGRQTEPEKAPSPVSALFSVGLGATLLVTVGAVATGYMTLAALVSGQVFWLAVLGAASFLSLRFADDLVGWLFAPSGWAPRLLGGVFSLRRSTVAQLGVLAAAALQLVILFIAVSLALTPFGDSGRLLLAGHLDHLGQAVRLGSATVSPRAVLSGLAVFAIGLTLIHLIRRWFVRRYLPVTRWDPGIRNSASTGLLYLGVVITVLATLGAMGLGFQQIALVASALSVGIGFGLQQIVQNFVSGVILLIERPVKVGDWVNVGGVEGDVRRIRVRATEIETFDRTTVIVPNSDLITKQVQNKTLGEPRARLQLDLAIANSADAVRARDLILKIAGDQAQVLKDPAPAVYIDALAAGGAVNFKCYLFVASPRDATRVRSEVYFAILAAFQAETVAFIGAAGAQNVVVEAGPKLTDLLAGAQKPPETPEPPPRP